MSEHPSRRAVLVAAAAVLAVGRPGQAAAVSSSRTLVAAGDMNSGAETDATGRLAQRQQPDLVATLGDHQYPVATLDALQNGYATTAWDGLRAKDHPVPGHHEYDDPGAKGYFAFFGKPAWYAYDIGLGWRGYALNSLVPLANQLAWLRSDLAAHRGASVVATWADPRWSSGVRHGNDPTVQPLLDAFAGHSGVVLNGHEHNYERFAPVAGLRQFVVGTGGSSSHPFGAPVAGSQFRLTGVPGVLVLRLLSAGHYTWRFLDVAGAARDSGSG